MRDLSDLNDLYNVLNVILFLEIIKNRFPRKCNSPSKLSGCIKKEQSKVILALPTINSVMEAFEKTLTQNF